MNLSSKFLPYGSLPYENLKFATAAMAKLFQEIPYLPDLPAISANESIRTRTLSCLPGVVIKNDQLKINIGTSEYQTVLMALNETYLSPTLNNLNVFGIKSEFSEKYYHMIKKFKSPYAVIHLLGPLTLSQILTDSVGEHTIFDKSFRKLFVQAVTVKALWTIETIKSANKNTIPIIIFEEPALGKIGDLKRENSDFSNELLINLYSKIFEKIKGKDTIVGIQCFEKCDWSIPINAGVDLISFDAYNKPNNLNIISELIEGFLKKGGIINWAIVPVETEKLVKNMTTEDLVKRLKATMSGLVDAGVPPELVYKLSTVSLNGNLSHLPVFFAEKAMVTVKQVASRLF